VTAVNVLRVNTVEERTSYREAVAEILRRVQTEHKVTLLEIADRIDVSLGTVSNAANKKTDLCGTYLTRLAMAYGPQTFDPFVALAGGRVVPLAGKSGKDILPFVARVNLCIANARDKDGPGGEREIHTERAGYLGDLIALQTELSKLICEIETDLAA
jgi:transcriptional regulator with XRE-family HTH domain